MLTTPAKGRPSGGHAEAPTQECDHVGDATVRYRIANIVRHAFVSDGLDVRYAVDHDVVILDRAHGLAARDDQQGRAFDPRQPLAPFLLAHVADEAADPGGIVLPR